MIKLTYKISKTHIFIDSTKFFPINVLHKSINGFYMNERHGGGMGYVANLREMNSDIY